MNKDYKIGVDYAKGNDYTVINYGDRKLIDHIDEMCEILFPKIYRNKPSYILNNIEKYLKETFNNINIEWLYGYDDRTMILKLKRIGMYNCNFNYSFTFEVILQCHEENLKHEIYNKILYYWNTLALKNGGQAYE